MTRIAYGLSSDAWVSVVRRIESLIEDRCCRRVIEVGGGANPTLSLDFVERFGLEYTLLDISQTELDKAPAGYLKVQADICAESLVADGEYDLAFSRMLAEHVPDGKRFHANVYSLLRKGGVAFHFFPTLFAPPFLVNRVLPEVAAASLLHLLQPGRERSGKLGKFPAFYSWCRGPLPGQIRRLEAIGYDVEEYDGFFGHEAYYQKIPLVRRMHVRLCEILRRNPIPALTSFAQIVLIKRGSKESIAARQRIPTPSCES